MLEQSGLKLEGNHHSGIDDARNIARCVIETLKKGYRYS
jgi:inhibitor of KinA sporulation pathway (predicted exonuclease)